MRASTSAVDSVMAIDGRRIFDDRVRSLPFAAVQPAIKTALATRMARNATLRLDDQQDRVAVAVETHLAHALHVARLLALVPQPCPRARPVMHFAGGDGTLERSAVHPRERQH